MTPATAKPFKPVRADREFRNDTKFEQVKFDEGADARFRAIESATLKSTEPDTPKSTGSATPKTAEPATNKKEEGGK
jgi:hypothetical protein